MDVFRVINGQGFLGARGLSVSAVTMEGGTGVVGAFRFMWTVIKCNFRSPEAWRQTMGFCCRAGGPQRKAAVTEWGCGGEGEAVSSPQKWDDMSSGVVPRHRHGIGSVLIVD